MADLTITATAGSTDWIYVPNVVYYADGRLTRRMQCIIPYRHAWETDERYPLVVFIPGAAWQRQEMYNGLPGLSALARRGYAIASVQVREAALASYPAQLEDIRRALHFLRGHAADFHLDMRRVVLAGDSSGAHLALMASLTGYAAVRGVIDLFGPTDLRLCGGPQSSSLLGVADAKAHPELAAAASCGTYITADQHIPPILIAHGLQDNIVKPEHSRLLLEQLRACGKRCEAVWVEGSGHGGPFWWSQPMLEILDGFMSRLWEGEA